MKFHLHNSLNFIQLFVLLNIIFCCTNCLARNHTLEEYNTIKQAKHNSNNASKENFVPASCSIVKATNGYPLLKNFNKVPNNSLYKYFNDISKKIPLGDFMLGYLHESGAGKKADGARAMKYYNKALKRGSVDAMYLIALKKHSSITDHMVFGKTTFAFAKKEYKESLKLFLKAAKLNHDFAQIMVATMYINGEIEYNNYKVAEKYIKKAIKTNEIDGYTALGAMYRDMGNFNKGTKYLELASNKGSVVASIILFQDHLCGTGKDIDAILANKYKKLAIDNAKAQSVSIQDIDFIFVDKCKKTFDLDKKQVFLYTSKDVLNDFLSKNRYDVGIIPSVFDSIIKNH